MGSGVRTNISARLRVVGVLSVVALVAAGCGSRVDERQAAAEAREDAERVGVVAGASGLASGSLDGGSLVGGGDTGATTGETGGGTTGVGGSTGGVPGSPASAFSGDNGGATDVGATADELRLGTVVTLTGPVPGLFRGALVGMQAWAAYQNSLGGLYGRNIRILAGDDSLDSGKNRAAHLQLKDKVFAFVGSFSVNDDGGAGVMKDCRCPDVGGSLSKARFNLPNHFTPQPQPNGWRGGPPSYYAKKYGNAVIKKLAFLVSGVEAAREIARHQRAVYEAAGFEVVYTREVAPNETNYTGDVVQMQRAGVQALAWQGQSADMGRLAAAMQQQGFKPALPNWGNDAYNENFIKVAGEGAEGAIIDQVFALFKGEDAGRIPEVGLFNQWMKRVDPNQTVDLFSMYGWLSGRLFAEAMEKAGPQAKRTKLIETLSAMGTWNGHGLVAPVVIGRKKPSDCFFIFKIVKGRYQRIFPEDKRNFACDVAGYKFR
jgi:ABC-type branched-subunit amino acid transport system substrate-binding protein